MQWKRSFKNSQGRDWSSIWMCGVGVKGSFCGIVGLGRIGLKVARVLRELGAFELLYSGPIEMPDNARRV